MKFSIVCPIKDEVDFIPRTFPSYYSIHPDEVIVCLDKPAPANVVRTVTKVAEEFGARNITKIIEVERNPKYSFHQAWVRRNGFRATRNDTILTVDIDLILDPRIKNHFHLLENDVKLVSFAKFSVTWHGVVAYLVQRLLRRERFTGLYLFSKSAWLETEDEASLERIPRGEDTHLRDSLARKYRDAFVADVRNVVIRPKENRKYQFLMGWNRWKIRRTPIVKVAISSFLFYRPQMMVGYLEARYRKARVAQKNT